MGIFAEISKELEGRKHVFIMWASQLVMVMVMVTTRSSNCLSSVG
jgi:hypothetical protein